MSTSVPKNGYNGKVYLIDKKNEDFLKNLFLFLETVLPDAFYFVNSSVSVLY